MANANREKGMLLERKTEWWKSVLLIVMLEDGKAGVRKLLASIEKNKKDKELKNKSDVAKTAIINGA